MQRLGNVGRCISVTRVWDICPASSIAYVQCGALIAMTRGAPERLIGESHRELERTTRASARAAGATGVLAGLLWPFDNRCRQRDTLAMRERTRELKRSRD